MVDKPSDKNLLPVQVTQNPSPITNAGQTYLATKRDQVDRIMEAFMGSLPSNYVSQVQGPFYTMQFQAVAEAIADFQLTAQEVYADSGYDYLRGEFLYQTLGALVFPDAQSEGYPELSGDLTYREFLKRMVTLLLQGATQDAIEGGLGLLSEATFEVIDKAQVSKTSRKKVWDPNTGTWKVVKGSVWGLDRQFEFEVNVSYTDPDTGEQRFPEDPAALKENVRQVLRALRPAHTLYDYRHFFRETFGSITSAESTWVVDYHHYEDFRKFCGGVKQIASDNGVTWTDRSLFSDVTVEFGQIGVGANLVVLSGDNSIHAGGLEGTVASTDRGTYGRFVVKDVLTFPVGTDSTARAYTTSPTGLSGTATVEDDVVTDDSQDWGNAVEGEVLTFASGPNAGSYRLKTVLGLTGGPVGGTDTGSGTQVRVAKCLLRLEQRMKYAATGQTYTVTVDRLGVQEPHAVEAEDVSRFFYL